MRAIGASAWLMCTAPVMTSRGDGTCTVRKSFLPSTSTAPLLPIRKYFSAIAACDRPERPWVTSRWPPSARLGDDKGPAPGALAAGVQSRERFGFHEVPDRFHEDRMVPPQDRPTFQAVSSATPY